MTESATCHSAPIDSLQWLTVLGDENPDAEHSPALDPELQLQAFDCDDRPDCAYVWTVAPTYPGRYTVWARAADTSGQWSAWVGTRLRVREPGATATPTATMTAVPPTPTATSTPVVVIPSLTPTQTATETSGAAVTATATPTATSGAAVTPTATPMGTHTP